jgi:pSer/pThr/pTyr-binding forkhead associated (FHA) protein
MLSGRVLIGRWSIHAIFVDDQTVSRIHAWIVPENDQYFITDGGSFNGTNVNGRPVGIHHPLHDGDLIQVGPESISFHEGTALPGGVEPIDLSPLPITHLRLRGGFFVDCACGAPLLVKDTMRGKHGRCRFCGHNHLLIPASQREEIKSLLEFDDAAPKKTPASDKKLCSVCHSPIGQADAIMRCPSCGLAFHAECWIENRGCAAYGCPQVGALDALPPDAIAHDNPIEA